MGKFTPVRARARADRRELPQTVRLSGVPSFPEIRTTISSDGLSHLKTKRNALPTSNICQATHSRRMPRCISLSSAESSLEIRGVDAPSPLGRASRTKGCRGGWGSRPLTTPPLVGNEPQHAPNGAPRSTTATRATCVRLPGGVPSAPSETTIERLARPGAASRLVEGSDTRRDESPMSLRNAVLMHLLLDVTRP